MFKAVVRLFFAFAIIVFTGGCSYLTKINSDNKRFQVSAYWVQDTLSAPNQQFRKVNRMSPVIYKDTVVIGNSIDGLVSYHLSNKNQKWRVPIEFGVEAGAAVINNRLFIGSNNGKMYSIDLDNGAIVWVFDTKSEIVSEPLIYDGSLFFISGNQILYSLDAATGKQLWIHNRQDTTSSLTVRGGSTPVVSGNNLFVGFSDGSIASFNVKTGAENWEITLNRNTKFKDIDASPVIDGDFLYVNSYDDKFYCLTKDKGQILWSVKYGGFGTPLVMQDKIFVTSSQGELVALSKKDGSLLWKKTTDKGIFTDLTAYEDLVIAGESQGKLLFLNQDSGKLTGAFEPGRGVFSKPTVHNNSVYFISGEGNIYGLRAGYESRSFIYFLK